LASGHPSRARFNIYKVPVPGYGEDGDDGEDDDDNDSKDGHYQVGHWVNRYEIPIEPITADGRVKSDAKGALPHFCC
jgi:hypothetical protein